MLTTISHHHDPRATARVDARFFRGLSDPTRLLILEALLERGESNVSTLMAELGLPRSRAATHLACLRACGYVSARREGRYVWYSVADERVRQLLGLARSLSLDHGDALDCCKIIDSFTAADDLMPLARPSTAQASAPAPAGRGAGASQSLSFGAWLAELMRARGMPVRSLAEKAGVSSAAVHRWLYRGGYPLPKVRARLAAALGIPIQEVREHALPPGDAQTSAFSAWLQEQLQSRDWTRAELARRMGLEPHATVPWFRRATVPRRRTLDRLAAVLGVEVGAVPTV